MSRRRTYRARITRTPQGKFKSLAVFQADMTVPTFSLEARGTVAVVTGVRLEEYDLPASFSTQVPLRDVLAEIRKRLDALFDHQDEEARAEQAAELANERSFEDRGWMEAMAERQWEDSRGVVQFEDAMDAAYGRRRA